MFVTFAQRRTMMVCSRHENEDSSLWLARVTAAPAGMGPRAEP